MKQIQKGFTLIELMIVVAIIGILAAVAIPAYQDYVVKAKLSKVTSTIDPLKLALVGYYQEYGGFPSATINTTTAPTGSMATANAWDSLGLTQVPTKGAEISEITLQPGGVIVILLQAIQAGTIDGTTVTMTAAPGGTGVLWTNTCTAAATVTVLHKYFNC